MKSISDIIRSFRNRQRERRHKEIEHEADRLVTIDIDADNTIYVCVSGVRVRMAVEEKPERIIDIDVRDLAAYVNQIKHEYIRQHTDEKENN